jgi:hypothetical protein
MSDITETPPLPEKPLMEIHKPKPIHNWRDFLKEVGTIVLGVCIALAAEQGVEWWHWHSQVAQARKAIATETATNISYGIRRMRFAPCLEKRLDDLSHIVDEASRTGTLPPVGELGDFTNNIWATGEWNSLMASQTASHFPHAELAGYNYIYVNVERANARTVRELDTMSVLYTAVGPGRKLDAASEDRLRGALSEARFLNRGVARVGFNLWLAAAHEKMVFSPADARLITDAQTGPLVRVGSANSTGGHKEDIAGCPAIAKPTATGYGQSQWRFVLPQVADMLKHPPKLQVGD